MKMEENDYYDVFLNDILLDGINWILRVTKIRTNIHKEFLSLDIISAGETDNWNMKTFFLKDIHKLNNNQYER